MANEISEETHDKILELFKKSIEEEPAAVESIFNELVVSKISDLVAQRKTQIAESIAGGEKKDLVDNNSDESEDDDFFPDEDEIDLEDEESDGELEESSFRKDIDETKPIIVSGVKGMKSTPFKKQFKHMDHYDKWSESADAENYTVHHIDQDEKYNKNRD